METAEIPRKWVQDHKFSNRSWADKILKPFLKKSDPDVPQPTIDIAPQLSKKVCIDIAFTKHMTPLFNKWQHRTQHVRKNTSHVLQ